MGIIEKCMRQSTDCWFISYIISVFSLIIFFYFTQKVIWLSTDSYSLVSIFALCFLLGYQFFLIKTILPNIQPTFEKLKTLFYEDQFIIFSQELERKIQFHKLYSLMIIAFFTLTIYESINVLKCELGTRCPIFRELGISCLIFHTYGNNLWNNLLDIYNVIVSYLMFFFLIVILWIMINITLIFIDLKNEKYRVNIDIYDLNKIKELKHLKSYIVFILINYFMVISLILITDLKFIPTYLPQGTYPSLDKVKIIIISNPFEVTMLVLMFFIGLVLLITTQKTIHKLIENSANIELNRISQKHKEICDKITDTSYNKKNSDNKNTLKELQINLDILEKEETRIKQIIGKYFDIKLLISIITTILIPLIGFAIQIWIALHKSG